MAQSSIVKGAINARILPLGEKAMASIYSLGSSSRFKYQVAVTGLIAQNRIAICERDTSNSPPGEKVIVVVDPSWPVSSCFNTQVAAIGSIVQSRIVLLEDDASILPSGGEKAIA